MRLLQSVLATLPQTRKPQRKFITHLLGLVLMLPGHATFRNLSRYSSCHERTFARWYDRPFDFVSLNKAAITQVIPPEHQQALVIDASFIPKSGTRTYGLEHFWNSRHRRSEKGLEVSAVAWLDITDNCACGLSVEQTPPSDKTSEPQGTRIDACLEQLRGVVCDHHLKHLRYLIADGYYSKRKFLDGVRALGLHQIGKLRRDANLRYFYQGLGHPGPGRPKTHDGKVQWDDLSRFERVQSEDDDVVLYHQVLNHVHLRRNLRVVLVVDTRTQRRAVLFSTDTDLDAQTLYRGYKARFQIEFLFRDAKQFTSLNACQARSQAKLHFHFNASVSCIFTSEQWRPPATRLTRFERVQSEDDDVVLYHQVLNHVHLRRNLRVVLVVDTRTQRRAVLFSTDTDLDAQTLYRGYKARFQIEFLFRDAKQFASLSACQARSQAKLHFHFNASMSALALGKLEARQQSGVSSALPSEAAFSLQCQHECSCPGQAGSAAAKRQCPGRLFHGQPQTARLQPTSAGANFSAFSPGAEPGKIQPRLPRPL